MFRGQEKKQRDWAEAMEVEKEKLLEEARKDTNQEQEEVIV